MWAPMSSPALRQWKLGMMQNSISVYNTCKKQITLRQKKNSLEGDGQPLLLRERHGAEKYCYRFGCVVLTNSNYWETAKRAVGLRYEGQGFKTRPCHRIISFILHIISLVRCTYGWTRHTTGVALWRTSNKLFIQGGTRHTSSVLSLSGGNW